MIIVTGGAGFIGSNYVHYLNSLGIRDVVIVDNFKNGQKLTKIAAMDIIDAIDKESDCLKLFLNRYKSEITDLVHLGACSSTQEQDGTYLLKNNFQYSKDLLSYCLINKKRLLYASSASVYGSGENGFLEDASNLKPLNAYAASKLMFDNYVRNSLRNYSHDVNIKGLRFFNVYGPGEELKGNMSSPIYKFYHQLQNEKKCKVFEEKANGKRIDHSRDFIHVSDCCKMIDFLRVSKTAKSGLYNIGSGNVNSFRFVAETLIKYLELPKACLSYIPFPVELKKGYQSYTVADMHKLRGLKYDLSPIPLEEGIKSYIEHLSNA